MKWYNTYVGIFLLLCLGLSSCHIASGLSRGLEKTGFCLANCTVTVYETKNMPNNSEGEKATNGQ